MLSIIFSLLLMVFGRNIQKLLRGDLSILQRFMNGVINARIYILLIVLITFFAIMMKILPNRKTKFISQLPGAIFSALGWYFLSFIISVYVDDFNGFSMYGSLTTWVLVMIWLYFCMYILLIGGKINMEYGEQIRSLFKRNRKIT